MKNEQTNNRQAQLSAYVAIAATGAAALAVAAISNSITGAIDSLPPATTAGIVTSLPVTLVSICGFASFGTIGAAAFIVAWRTPRAAQRQYRDDDEPRIIASPLPAQIQQQQIRQLPPPPAQTEPRFAPFRGDIVSQVQREAQRAAYAEDEPESPEIATFTSDYGFQPQYDDEPQMPQYAPEPPPIATNQRITARLGNGDDISISAAAWLAFASLDKPNRDDWRMSLKSSGNSAPNSDYGKCKQIADQYHLLSGAGVWISPKMRDTITQWLTQP